MQELDFSALNSLTPVIDTPYRPKKQASEPQKGTPEIDIIPTAGGALNGKIQGFNDELTQHYKEIYRLVFECHMKHRPPIIDTEEQPEGEYQYWTGVYGDIQELAKKQKDDPFLIALLVAVYRELERESQTLKGEQG